MKLRWIVAVCAAFSALVAGVASAAAISGCGLMSCPATAPTVSIGQPTSSVSSVATLTGTVNPGGAATSYVFHCQCGTGADGTPPASSSGTLAASTTPQTVTFTITGTSPNTDAPAYLTASNTVGSATSPTVTVTTPLAPPVPVTLTNSAPKAYTPVLVASVPAADAGTKVELQVQYQGTTGFVNAAYTYADSSGQASFSEGGAPPNVTRAFASAEYTRNATFRAEAMGCVSNDGDDGPCETVAPTSFSSPFTYTTPPIRSASWGPNILKENSVGEVTAADLRVNLMTYPVSRSYRGPVAYLYYRSGHAYRRFTESRITGVPYFGGSPVDAGVIFPQARLRARQLRGDVAVCTPTPAVPYAGPAFRFSGCGARTLPATRPPGSTWFFANLPKVF